MHAQPLIGRSVPAPDAHCRTTAAAGRPWTGVPLGCEDLERVRTFLARRFGIWIRDAWLSQFQSRLSARMEAVRAKGFGAYWELLQSSADSPGEAQQLIEEICIHETQFARAAGHFDILRRVVIPERLAARPGEKIRIACLACSTGEEAYTLAMTACEAIYGATADAIEITGFDLSSRALARAREARYSDFQLRDVPPARRARWFIGENGVWTPRPEIKALVRFCQHNLIEPLPLAGMDVIFCRNVLIYFRPELVRQLIAEFHAALNPGGYLFLGHAESAHDRPDLFRPIYSDDSVYYQRQFALSPGLETTKILSAENL